MNETKFEDRYSRQIRLPQIGEAGQAKLRDARVLIIGMGGLGSPVALYLAAAGVGFMRIADFDQVDESNLQRQIIHQHADIGELKAESAACSLQAINPDIEIETLDYSMNHEDFLEQSRDIDGEVDRGVPIEAAGQRADTKCEAIVRKRGREPAQDGCQH